MRRFCLAGAAGRPSRFFFALVLLLRAAAAAAAIEGTVATAAGQAVEGARVRLLGSAAATGGGAAGLVAVTGRRGEFSFPGVAPPARLRIEHPRFEPLAVEVVTTAPGTWNLVPRQEVFDEIVVTAGRERGGGVQPVSVATTSLAPLDRATPAGSLAELIEGAPGVAENGQGGLFQAFSIRGVAGQRVMALVGGARIVTERRAGATASFVDPLLLSEVDVVRGPYSSFYGSGALGGLVQALPARFRDPVVDLGYESQGGAVHARAGWGGASWSLGLAHRRAGDAETAAGEGLFSRFEQTSAILLKDFRLGSGLEAEWLLLPAAGRDIGKPNAQVPERVTRYPREDHLVTRLTLRRPGRWRLDLFAHPNRTITRTDEGTEEHRVENEAFDLGANLQRELDLPGGWAAQAGVELFGRRGVEATERTVGPPAGASSEVRTLAATEDEVAFYGALRRGFARVNLEAGGRLTWLRQDNAGSAAIEDRAWSGFAGLTAPLGGGFELAANLGSGLRFPALAERYFSGTTGRGDVVANAGLAPERALSADLGLRWYGERVFAAVYGFRNEIDDFIERVEVAPGVRTFVNLTSGRLAGLEAAGFFQATEAVRLTWSGQRVRGRAAGGQPLADVAADRLEATLAWNRGRWSAACRLQHRFAKHDPGPGEQETGAAELLSGSLTRRWPSGLGLSLQATNLLDEEYLPSADELAVAAEGRSLGVGLSWNR